MTAFLQRVGLIGVLALGLIAAAGAFQIFALEPMESELRALEASVRENREPVETRRVSTPAAQLANFYQYFDQSVSAHERLAQLHVIARASGVELPSADYQMLPTGTRLTRYQLRLPLNATYGQARAFMANALNAIPILSVDQATFRRTRANDPRLDVEIVMTLHLLEP